LNSRPLSYSTHQCLMPAPVATALLQMYIYNLLIYYVTAM